MAIKSKSKTEKPVNRVRTKIDPRVELQLFTRSAGRCQFPGCGRFLLEYYVSKRSGNVSNKAHIVAFSKGGPRGDAPIDPKKIDSFENLMLLCYSCHKDIDDNPKLFSVELLRRYKQEQEDRMFALTAVKPETTTRVMRMEMSVRNQPSTTLDNHIWKALDGFHFDRRDTVEVLFPDVPDDNSPAYWQLFTKRTEAMVDRLLSPELRSEAKLPISVFAIARIPLLVHLGSVLSSKVDATIYNRDYRTNGWEWQTEGMPSSFSFDWINDRDSQDVCLLVSLSGTVEFDKLPPDIRVKASIAQITISSGITDRGCMQNPLSVQSFSEAYQFALQEIRRRKPAKLHLFPAVPVAAAVYLGRMLLPSVDPPALVYDWIDSTYQYTITVNNNDN